MKTREAYFRYVKAICASSYRDVLGLELCFRFLLMSVQYFFDV